MSENLQGLPAHSFTDAYESQLGDTITSKGSPQKGNTGLFGNLLFLAPAVFSQVPPPSCKVEQPD